MLTNKFNIDEEKLLEEASDTQSVLLINECVPCFVLCHFKKMLMSTTDVTANVSVSEMHP